MIAKIVPAVRLPSAATEQYEYSVPEQLAPAILPGAVVIVPFAGRRIPGLVMSVHAEPTTAKALKEVIGIAEGLSPLPDYVPSLWQGLSSEFATTMPRLLWAALPAVPARAISASSSASGKTSSDMKRPASELKSYFVNSAANAYASARKISAAGQGRQTLVLVPTVEEASIWAKELGAAMVLHSKLSTGAKYRVFSSAARGVAGIYVATKIGAFLPFADLALAMIVSSGSQNHIQEDQDPRFDARVVVERLAEACGASVAAFDPLPPLGLTPEGSGGRWVSANAPLYAAPIVHDLHDAAKAKRAKVLICDELEQALGGVIASGGRALVMLNRRGTASSYVCKDCGESIGCASCRVPLTAHEERMSCFSCEKSFPLPSACMKCGSVSLRSVGFGSKALYGELKKIFPDAAIAHIDREGMTAPSEIARCAVVVGTSAVFSAIPADIEPFDLVADAAFGAGQAKSGIWSSEASARLGRTLRSFAKKGGEVHIQTFDRDAPALKALSAPEIFIADELKERKDFGYPPTRKLVTIYGSGKKEGELFAQATRLRDALAGFFDAASITDPEWMRPKLFRGKYRLEFSAKTALNADLSSLARNLPEGFFAKVSRL